jgi:hypothetical protein
MVGSRLFDRDEREVFLKVGTGEGAEGSARRGECRELGYEGWGFYIFNRQGIKAALARGEAWFSFFRVTEHWRKDEWFSEVS